MALKKNSPYTKFFKKGLQDMIRNGELHLHKQRNSEQSSDCNLTTEHGNPLGFLKMASIFAILLFGTILSTILLIFECFKKPKTVMNDKEKIKLFNKQIYIMKAIFQERNMEELKSICHENELLWMKTGKNYNTSPCSKIAEKLPTSIIKVDSKLIKFIKKK